MTFLIDHMLNQQSSKNKVSLDNIITIDKNCNDYFFFVNFELAMIL